MAFGQGGGGNQPPSKLVAVGSFWSGQTQNNTWKASGGLDRDLPQWKLDLLGYPEVKLMLLPSKAQGNDGAPDINMFLRVPEELLPQEYWDEQEDYQVNSRQGSRNYQGGGRPSGGRGYSGGGRDQQRGRSGGYGQDDQGYERQAAPARPSVRPAPTSTPSPRGRVQEENYPPRQETRQRAAPAVRPAYQDRGEENNVFDEDAPPQRASSTRSRQEQAPVASRGRGREVPQADDDDLEDPFEK